MKRAIVLLSGGMDSALCLFALKASKRYSEILCLAFEYGQQHSKELEYAKKLAQAASCQIEVRNIASLFTGSTSALFSSNSNAADRSDVNSNAPSTFVPGRNALFLSIAYALAGEHGYDAVVIGSQYSSEHPDNQQPFLESMERTMNLAISGSTSRADKGYIALITPVAELSKAKMWKEAQELGCVEQLVINTLSDYNGNETLNEWGRGMLNNAASYARAAGYYEAKGKGWIV